MPYKRFYCGERERDKLNSNIKKISHYPCSGCFKNGYFYFNPGMRVIRLRIGSSEGTSAFRQHQHGQNKQGDEASKRQPVASAKPPLHTQRLFYYRLLLFYHGMRFIPNIRKTKHWRHRGKTGKGKTVLRGKTHKVGGNTGEGKYFTCIFQLL